MGVQRSVPFFAMQPSHTALGTWSGGRFMHFGESLSDERLEALLRPGDGIDTVITADAYGAGEADRLLGRALQGVPNESYSLVGAVGHDFYEGTRRGSKGYPRFTDPELRGPDGYADYLRMATERSLERIGASAFDVLLLHNPDRTGYSSPEVWEGMAALRQEGLVHALGIAPGPANGFTLDVIDCLERFGEIIDWAMVILNPMEPWPGQLVLPAARRHGVRVICRVVDYGGLFWDDVRPGHAFAESDHRLFRPDGWIESGRARLERMRPIAERHGLTPLQLACAWDLAQEPVECVAPTLIQEPGLQKTIEAKRAELAAVPEEVVLSAEEVEELRAIGDNTGSMVLKGASPDHDGPASRTAGRWTTSSRSSPRAGPSTQRATSSRPREARAAVYSPAARRRAAGRVRDVHRDSGLRRAGRRDHLHDRVGRRVELVGDGRPRRCELAHHRVAQLRARRQLPRRRLVVQRLHWRTGKRFTGRVVQAPLTNTMPLFQRPSVRIDWGDGTRGTGTVRVRGAVLSVTARHTWRRPLRRGRIVVTVTDAATGGTLTIRRAVRIA